MTYLTRRDLLKAGLAVTAGSALGNAGQALSLLPSQEVAKEQSQTVAAPSRERLLLDFNWRFHLGNADDPGHDFGFGRGRHFAKTGGFFKPCNEDFNDSDWRSIDLPHDWAVELPFENAEPLVEYGSKPLGRLYPATSIGWYRRVFELPATDVGRRLAIEFDGVFRDSMVALNGHFLERNLSGYAPFRVDVTDVAKYGGKNILAVRVDATENEGWFYEGAGIYRHVWLVKTHPVHVVQWGTAVTSEIGPMGATLTIVTEVANESGSEQACQVQWRISTPSGAAAANADSVSVRILPGGRHSFTQQVLVSQPALWSIESPSLYHLATTVAAEGEKVDHDDTTFGIRTIHFDSQHGFFLNGTRLELKGTCNHQDHAGVGVALPDRLQFYRIEKLKEMGANAYRTAHNPPTPELLDACDRLGMLVLDETRMFSSSKEGLSQLERMIRRDRNHPSIFCWSLANEEWAVQGEETGRRIAESMRQLAHRLDPSRPVTAGMDGGYSAGEGIARAVDVEGFNYQREDLDAFHRNFPNRPTLGTETASTYSTRGIYKNDPVTGYLSAYDVNRPDYAATAEQWWTFFANREFLAGGFVWTGFDYRGEPSPYGWPCISSHFGIMDTCGFPKDNYFYYQAWWGSKPVLHLFPHWNWSGKEGQDVEVWCHTNLDSVELFLNGTRLGAKRVEHNSHVEWKVKYAPGVLEARGLRDGRVVISDKRETTGAPARLMLRPDRSQIAADGEDLSIVRVEVLDTQGRIVPVASNEISFRILGQGRLIGSGNGDPSCHEPDKPVSFREGKRSAFNGLCMVLVQALKQTGEIRLQASAPGLETASVLIRGAASQLRPAVD